LPARGESLELGISVYHYQVNGSLWSERANRVSYRHNLSQTADLSWLTSRIERDSVAIV